MIGIIYQEYKAKCNKKSLIRALLNYFINVDFEITCKIRKITRIKNKYIKIIYINRLNKKHGVKIGYNLILGRNFTVHHHNGIIIGNDVIIGNNCNIYQQVTLGQKNNKYPKINDNVTLYPGCKIIGDITIGNNSVIAPNSVVIKDVPDNAIVSGIPSVIIGWRNDISE